MEKVIAKNMIFSFAKFVQTSAVQLTQQRRIRMLNNDQLETALNASPKPRVTKEYMESRITDKSFSRFSGTVTICQITLDNGYSVRGESACVNPENYNQEIGERIAYDNAFNKLWPLFGFLLAEQTFAPEAKQAA